MYQPVSYRLAGRMGTRDDLRSTIHACRNLGVRVYADAVVCRGWGEGPATQVRALLFLFSFNASAQALLVPAALGACAPPRSTT
jgi:hypothetical protein